MGVGLVFWSIALLGWTEPGVTKSEPVVSVSSNPPVIVIGFVGGFVKHDDPMHEEVQLAKRLRESYPSAAYAQVFENHHREQAHEEILRLLDTNRDHTLSADERENARIVIFGHSWGGSETLALARQLDQEGIPVRLTIQVDSIHKLGQNDDLVPPNVAEAVNFFQPNGFLHGRSTIRAAEPAETRILGNHRIDYNLHPVACVDRYPWYARPFMRGHLEIECDPQVWGQIESLIRGQIVSSPIAGPS
jgi:pimeloyl-ACP methyl ester carboxylesterase